MNTMGSVYDDCPHCSSGVHQDCVDEVEGVTIICTCPICNALSYREEIHKQHCILTKEQFNNMSSTIAWHIEKMTPKEQKTYLYLIGNKKQCAC